MAFFPLNLPVTEATAVGHARRAAAMLAAKLQLDEAKAGRLALLVTEAANNLAKFGHGGELILQPTLDGGAELLALDAGPGMANVTACLQDGYSTVGTPGTGLGAIRRVADESDLYSWPGIGTALLARLRPQAPEVGCGAPALKVGAVSLPKPGEAICGDAWSVWRGPSRSLFLVVDGLGHGPAAADAALAAVRSFRANTEQTGAEILQRMHAALRRGRGAAIAVTEIDHDARLVQFTGIGNISATVATPAKTYSMVSHNGIVGHQIRKTQTFTYPWPSGATLILHSDGLGTSWRLDRYPGLLARDPALLAGRLYLDFRRGRDDVTVVVAREPAFQTESLAG